MPTVSNFSVSEFTVEGPNGAAVMDYVVTDINLDGYDDVLVTYFYYPMQDSAIPMTILLGSENGLSPAPAGFITGGSPENVWGRQIVVADFNNDGRPDFYVADHGYDAAPFPGAQNSLVLSTAGGGFTNATANLPQLTDFSHSAAAGDFNGDGNIDLFVNNYNGGTEEASYLLFGDGNGGFTLNRDLPADMVAGNYNSPATAAYDIDGDGDLDLLLTPNFSDEQDVRILLNDGVGNFTAAERSFTIAPIGTHDGVVDVAIGDVTGDGLPDMVFSIAVDNYASDGRIAIFVNQGNGSFVDETATLVSDPQTPNWTLRNQLVDVNNDGFVDIVQVNSGGATDGPILLNDGTGHFIRLPSDYSGGFDAFTGAYEYDRVFAGDFNGDGRTDLAAYRYSDGGTQIWAVHRAVDPPAVQTGNAQDNALVGGDGNERLNGLGGNDVLFGGAGNDILEGGAGDDRLVGGSGADTASYAGASGAVALDLGIGEAQNSGGAGTDILSGIENLTGSAYADVLFGDEGANALIGLGGIDRLYGRAGNDVLDGGAGADIMRGGAGDDVYYVDNRDDLAVELAGEGTDIVYSSVTYRLRADVEDLILTGTAVRGIGNDLVNRIIGNSSANILDGGAGADIMRGGAGDDIYYVDNAGDRIAESAGEGTDLVYSSVSYALRSNLENLTLTGSAVRAAGNNLVNRLVGTDGVNVLNGGLGADIMRGGGGNDIYYVETVGDHTIESSGEGRDRVYTLINWTLEGNVEDVFARGSDNINLVGNTLDNVLVGNSGNNVLDGRGGADDLRGALGADTFVFRDGDFGGMTPSTADRIIDFSHAQGDVIDLHLVDAHVGQAGDQAFAFIGTAAFTHTAGQLRYEVINGNTYVYGDTNGDGTADFLIRLDGGHTLVGGDFIL